MTPKEKLIQLFVSRPYVSKSQLGFKNQKWPPGREQALSDLENDGRIQKCGQRYYLDHTIEKEKARLEGLTSAKKRLFTESVLKGKGQPAPPNFRKALDNLVDDRLVSRFEIEGAAKVGFVFLHRKHAGTLTLAAPEQMPDNGSKIRTAYDVLCQESGNRSVFISDLVKRSGLALPDVHHWLREAVIKQGIGTLDEADWASADEEKRSAAFTHLNRARLYVRLHT